MRRYGQVKGRRYDDVQRIIQPKSKKGAQKYCHNCRKYKPVSEFKKGNTEFKNCYECREKVRKWSYDYKQRNKDA